MKVHARADLYRRRGAWLLAFALTSLLFVVADEAQGQTVPATLTGQYFGADELSGLGGVALAGVCDPDGTSTVEYTATGVAVGPYSGTFTESGRATIGPQTTAPGEGTTGAILAFEATFTLDSPSGQVTGRKFIVDPGWRGGNCTDPSSGNNGAYRIFVPQESGIARYEAVISTPEGTFADRGSARVAVLGQPAEPNRDSFEEVFVSET